MAEGDKREPAWVDDSHMRRWLKKMQGAMSQPAADLNACQDDASSDESRQASAKVGVASFSGRLLGQGDCAIRM